MDTDFQKYLESRNIPESTIDKLKEEKLDHQVIATMDLEELKPFFSTLGDRIAIREYCKRKIAGGTIKKQSLIEKLQEKMFKKGKRNEKRKKKTSESTSEEGEEEPHVKKDERNKTYKKEAVKSGLKQTRKVHFGWLCSEDENRHVHVKSNKGGGTRSKLLSKSSTKADILKTAKSLFFPEGKSPKGSEDKFNFDIWDYSHKPLLPDVTVQEMFDVTGLTRLTFYLASTEITSTVTSANQDIRSLRGIESYEGQQQTIAIDTEDDEPIGIISSIQDCSPHNTITFSDIVHDALTDVSTFELTDEHLYFTNEEEITETPLDTPTLLEIPPSLETSPSPEKPLKLRVHRGMILEEFIEIFQDLDPTICDQIQITVVSTNGIDEAAVDFGEVLRDCLSEFWESFYSRYTVGTDYKVPFVRHDINHRKWLAISRIIILGWKQVKYFPLQLAPPFMQYCIFGMVNSNLQESLLHFISDNERKCLENAIKDFKSVDFDELLDVLGELDCKTIPNESNLIKLCNEIAHTQIIQKPLYVIESWSTLLKSMVTIDELDAVYEKCQPNPKNIINNLLSLETSSTPTVFNYLKKYIRECNKERRCAFLRFCTGANIITDNLITITYSESGDHRKPIAHTCGCPRNMTVSLISGRK